MFLLKCKHKIKYPNISNHIDPFLFLLFQALEQEMFHLLLQLELQVFLGHRFSSFALLKGESSSHSFL